LRLIRATSIDEAALTAAARAAATVAATAAATAAAAAAFAGGNAAATAAFAAFTAADKVRCTGVSLVVSERDVLSVKRLAMIVPFAQHKTE
jgi:hypothetical protein